MLENPCYMLDKRMWLKALRYRRESERVGQGRSFSNIVREAVPVREIVENLIKVMFTYLADVNVQYFLGPPTG